MNFDFALFLVVITALSGLIWLIDGLLFARKRALTASLTRASDRHGKLSASATYNRVPIVVEYARSFFPVLLVVLVLRSFLFEPFRIPSESMLPTLLVDDFILVNKFSYGVRLPVLHTKILDIGAPKRGDVAVFRFPGNPKIHYIKRIIGVPGDKISYSKKHLTINGVPVSLRSLGPYLPPGEARADVSLLRSTETLDAVEHDILTAEHDALTTSSIGYRMRNSVPQGYYFVMGDNRDNSNDSRVWGLVPESNLVGKAILIWMNLDFHWDRFGSSIR